MKRLLLPFILAVILLLNGCAHVISEQSRQLVDRDTDFAALRQDPDHFIGRHVMVGGRIARVQNSREGAEVEIVQFSLSPTGQPEDAFITSGRFLATSSDFLDKMIFRQGRLITLVGEVKGKTTRPLDGMDYTYPLIALREWYLWSDAEERDRYFYPPSPYYDPYFSGYGYEPYWYRPVGPFFRPR
jgi:outer membrane lipoprotein